MSTHRNLNILKRHTNNTGDKLVFFIVEALPMCEGSQITVFKRESFSSTIFMNDFTIAAKADGLNVEIKKDLIHIERPLTL